MLQNCELRPLYLRVQAPTRNISSGLGIVRKFGDLVVRNIVTWEAVGKILIGTPFSHSQKLHYCLVRSVYFHDQTDLVTITAGCRLESRSRGPIHSGICAMHPKASGSNHCPLWYSRPWDLYLSNTQELAIMSGNQEKSYPKWAKLFAPHEKIRGRLLVQQLDLFKNGVLCGGKITMVRYFCELGNVGWC